MVVVVLPEPFEEWKAWKNSMETYAECDQSTKTVTQSALQESTLSARGDDS